MQKNKIECAVAIGKEGAFSDYQISRLKEIFSFTAFRLINSKDNEGIQFALDNADVAVYPSDADTAIYRSDKLRWVHCCHAGVEKCTTEEIFKKNILLTSSSGRSAPALAEHVIFFILSLAYQSPRLFAAQSRKEWGFPGYPALKSITGKNAGIIGFGNTGREAARRIKALDMNVLAYDKHISDPNKLIDEAFSPDNKGDLEKMLKKTDFLILSVTLNDQTYHLIGREQFAIMKPSAVIINISRGKVIDEEALVEALYNKTIAGAGLDVFAVEHLPGESRLWEAPNTIITPHNTPQLDDRDIRSMDILEKNVELFLKGEVLINQRTIEDLFTK